MLQIIFIAGLSYASLYTSANPVNTCDPIKCKNIGPFIDTKNPLDVFPDEEVLIERCPLMLAALECFNDTTKTCLGRSLLHLNEAEDYEDAGFVKFYNGVTSVFADLCNINSDLHKRYSANVECVRNLMFDTMVIPSCSREVNKIYFEKYLQRDSETEERERKEQECMASAHGVACVASEIHKNCGEAASFTVIEMFKRSNIMHISCSNETLAELQQEYIDFLQLEDEQRSLFEIAFDVRKRK